MDTAVWIRDGSERVVAGASLGLRTGRLKIALLRCRGDGWELRCRSIEAMTLPPQKLRTQSVAGRIAAAFAELCQCCGVRPNETEVFGIDGVPPPLSQGRLAALVAEQTGITVVSGFEFRDRACGGRGRPLSALPDWLLFRSPRIHRLLLHLGRGLQITWLPAAATPWKILCFDAGPCCAFLDDLTAMLSQGRYPFDPSGHFAVQGRHCDALLEQWLSHPYLLRLPPKFLDQREFGDDFRDMSLTLARDHRLSARDVLCTANQFIVRCAVDAVRRFAPMHSAATTEVWVTGGGIFNGFLWKLLSQGLSPLHTQRSDEMGIPSEARGAVHAALLGYFAMENIAGNIPQHSGAHSSRILGQITPGSPENWDRWVCNLADRFEVADRQAA